VASSDGNHLVLKIGSNGDRIQIDNFLSSTYAGIKQVQFADGTVWSHQQLINMETTGTSGNDVLWGTTGADLFDGKGGNDVERGRSGNDTFIYNAGYGQLEIDEFDYSSSAASVLSLGAGIAPSDLSVVASSDGNHLVLKIGSNGDRIQIDNFLSSTYAGIKQVQFADGTVWSHQQLSDAVKTFTWTGSSTNATLVGNDYGSNIFQLGGGSEVASGGQRNNVYQVSATTGQAAINLSSVATSKNELDFLGGITDENLWFTQSGSDLKIDLLGTNTSVTVDGWFSGASAEMQEIIAGGLKIDSQISQLVQAMATYSANNAGFDPTSSSIHALPNDGGLQNTVAAAWHA
jgi:Ca2+-binding RTX toxin-like protein